MSHYALMKCRLNQTQFIMNLQEDWQDLQKWRTLMMSFVNFKTAQKVKIQATTYKENFFTYVLVYTVRWTFSNLLYSFAYFASAAFTVAKLCPCTLETKKSTDVIRTFGSCICLWQGLTQLQIFKANCSRIRQKMMIFVENVIQYRKGKRYIYIYNIYIIFI